MRLFTVIINYVNPILVFVSTVSRRARLHEPSGRAVREWVTPIVLRNGNKHTVIGSVNVSSVGRALFSSFVSKPHRSARVARGDEPEHRDVLIVEFLIRKQSVSLVCLNDGPPYRGDGDCSLETVRFVSDQEAELLVSASERISCEIVSLWCRFVVSCRCQRIG